MGQKDETQKALKTTLDELADVEAAIDKAQKDIDRTRGVWGRDNGLLDLAQLQLDTQRAMVKTLKGIATKLKI